MKAYRTYSSDETKKLGEELAKKLLEKRAGKYARVVALLGDLGAGKTTFTQGFMKGLGIRARILSPTFIIFRKHRIALRSTNSLKPVPTGRQVKAKSFSSVYHMDAYRIKDPKELTVLEFEKILENPENIVLIEWAEKIKQVLPKDTMWVRFEHGKKENERKIIYV